MKILLVTNKSLLRDGIERIDGGYWNLYVPLIQLGHNVKFYDILNGDTRSFTDVVINFEPNLIFCCLTFNNTFAKFEHLEEIKNITNKGNIKTFNWFCDDTWRFEETSSKVCWNFTACSTPEPLYLEKYKQIGYTNILLGCWHSNEELIKPTNNKIYDVSFCGGLNSQRASMMQFLKNQKVKVNYFHGVSHEDMLVNYSLSKIGVNFSKNANDPKNRTQMKARMIEIPACGSLLVTENTPGLECLFDINKEIVIYNEEDEMLQKINYLLNNDSLRAKIAKAGYERFLKEHTSKIRLKKILEEINKI